MNRILIVIITLVLTSSLFFNNTKAELRNRIVVKVGSSLVSAIDIRNEIITTLLLTGQEVNQENINKNKNLAIKQLISNTIKRDEITKYETTEYSKKDLNNYIEQVTKKFNTNVVGLKKIFNIHELSYEDFVRKQETQLLWNTLIFDLYRNQININIIEVENEVKKLVDSGTETDENDVKKQILFKKKNEKLGLFSRSHYSNLENKISIKFQ